MTKFYAQEKRVFDINKVTVVGSPTITNDGVASGFKSYNSGDESYLTLPTVFNPQDKPWKIIIKATIGEWVSGAPYESLLGTGIQGRDNQGIALALGGSNTIACWLGSTGTSWDIGTIRTNLPYISGKTYYFKVEFTGTKYVLSVSEDNINWEIKGSIESTTPIYVSAQPLTIGDNKYNNVAGTCWTGSIDLMETYVYIGDQVFFNPTKQTYLLERRKEGFDLSKFTVVGSPVITEYGLVSDGTTQNYCKISNLIFSNIGNKKWKLSWQGTMTLAESGGKYVFGDNYLSTNSFINVGRFNSSANLFFFNLMLNKNGIATSTPNKYINQQPINVDNNPYKGSVEYTGDKYILTLEFASNIKYSVSIDETEPIMPQNNDLAVGYNWQREINLTSIILEVDGQEVFTGAKEKFYAMRGM